VTHHVAMPATVLRTERLVLRGWRPEDRDPYAALNADPEVMEHFVGVLDRATSDAEADRFAADLDRDGWGHWVVTRPADDRLIGFTGLDVVDFPQSWTPATEIGWRFARGAWGHGYATEAARAVLGFAFGTLALDEVVSFTATTNLRSQRVMERIGMRRDPANDFDHPRVPVGHRLRRHVLYRLDRATWQERPVSAGISPPVRRGRS
jgi:RimJ/RimL family protein N-acetyltransferase